MGIQLVHILLKFTQDSIESDSIGLQIINWYNNLVKGQSDLAILSFWIGVMSLIISGAAAIYALIASRKAKHLLNRWILYNYRDLDKKLVKLSPKVYHGLMNLYEYSRKSKSFSREEAKNILGNFHKQIIERLLDDDWLTEKGEQITINSDRRPFLKIEFESKETFPNKSF